MAATKSLKSSDRQNILKKLVTDLKKRYRVTVPKTQRPVMETLLFAALLEDSSPEDAEAAYKSMLAGFFDLNEMRVSSVNEIEQTLGSLYDAAWKSLRVRETLQHTFEHHFSFDLDPVRRKTQETALKELSAIPYQTPFMRSYVLQNCLGAHLIPVDQRIHDALIWLGLSEAAHDSEHIADDLKGAVKKADGPHVFLLLKALSVDPEFTEIFARGTDDETLDPFAVSQRLSDLISGKYRNAKPTKTSKTVSRKKPAPPQEPPERTAPAKKPVKAAAPKAVAKKVTKKKPAAQTPKRKTKKSR